MSFKICKFSELGICENYICGIFRICPEIYPIDVKNKICLIDTKKMYEYLYSTFLIHFSN